MANEEMLLECTEKLNAIAASVTSEDKKEAIRELGIHYITVHRYLNGIVKKIDTGIALYQFLNARIESRKTALA